jgi:tetratricopeptide (TPR) repeat protein
MHLVEPHRSELSSVERIWLDWHRAYLRGDLPAAYHAAHQGYERAPGSLSRYLAAMYALDTNRPGEAVALLRKEPPASRTRTAWYYFHSVLADALHVLGKHEEELEAARAARRIFSDRPGPVYLEARALAGLDRPGEAEALVDEIMMLASSRRNAAAWMRQTGDALAADGHRDAARRVYDRALKALQDQGSPETPAEMLARADLLRRVGGLDEAAALSATAHAADPDDRQAQALVGIIAAQRGDRGQAERIAAELAGRNDSYDYGGNTYDRACIRAQLGDLDRAVELLRQSHAEGQPIGYWIRVDPDLQPLHGYPAYEDLLRPKG